MGHDHGQDSTPHLAYARLMAMRLADCGVPGFFQFPQSP
jgi:hypothetical protein